MSFLFMNEITKLMDDYRQKYDITDQSTPNDIGNLETLVRNQIYIRKIQTRLDELADSDDIENSMATIGRMQDSLMKLIEQNLSIEKTLGIDRKSRKKDDSESVENYIDELRRTARSYLDKILIMVYCPNCKVLVGRVLPVHDHTEFRAQFQCSQCSKLATVERKERDVFFDLKDTKGTGWRKKYPVEIVHPDHTDIDVEEENIIDAEN